MFDDAFEKAFDNIVGRIGNFVPDWLQWIFSLQFETWSALLIGLAVGFTLAKLGPWATGILIGAFLFIFKLGRKSKK